MKYGTLLTATKGLSSSFVPRFAEVFAAPNQRPPVIWLHFGECTGCSEATLRTQYPYPNDLVLEVMRSDSNGKDAGIIGEVEQSDNHKS
jgi:[NiFe] hydrogenase small subunit